MPTLHILTEGFTQKTFDLQEGITTIGRDDDNAIHIQDSSMSGTHGQFTVASNQVAYKDLGSTNGSFVDEQQVTEVILPVGTEFRLASVLMMLGNGDIVPDRSKRTTAQIKVAPRGLRPEELTAEIEAVDSPFKQKKGGGGRFFLFFIIILILAIVAIVMKTMFNLI